MASNFQDTSSEDEIDIECTQNEKELYDFVLDKYRTGVFELFNNIATKLDQIKRQKRFGEKIIKHSLEEVNRIIKERNKKKTVEKASNSFDFGHKIYAFKNLFL